MDTGQRVGYARVSSADQDLTTQRQELERLGCHKVFAEKVSGAATRNRPQLEALIEYVREGDEVHVTKLDRLARDAQDALRVADALREKRVGLVIHDLGGMDVNSEVGRLVYTVLAAVAEMERKRIRARQREGIERARAEGKYLGRAPALDKERIQEVRRLVSEGVPKKRVAEQMGVSRTTIYKALE